jgi:hypothetical protein
LRVDLLPRLRLCAQDRYEEAASAAAGNLRLVKCQVGVGDEFIDIVRAIGAGKSSPGTRGRKQTMTVDLKTRLKTSQKRGHDLGTDKRISATRPNQQKLIASDTINATSLRRDLRYRLPTSFSSRSPVEWPSVSMFLNP